MDFLFERIDIRLFFRLTSSSRNAKDSLFTNEPFHAIFHIQSQQHHSIFLCGRNQVEGFQTRRKGIDAGQDLRIGGVDVRCGQSVRANRPESQAGAQRVQRMPVSKALIQSPAPLVSQFGILALDSASNVSSLVGSRGLWNDR